jgi:DNA-binding CsgD family transcriptional regulator
MSTNLDRSTQLDQTLDLIRMGVAVLAWPNSVIRLNSAMTRILGSCDGLALDGGALTATEPSSASRLASRLARAFTLSEVVARSPERMAIQITRPSGLDGYQLTLVPDPLARRVTIFVGDPSQDLTGAAGVMRELYGLTAGESTIATLLAEGMPLKKIADQRAISVETVRWTLKRCFDKTGVSRQVDLVRILVAATPILPRD